MIKGVNPATGTLSPNSYLTSNPWNDELPAPYSAALPFGQPAAEHQGYSNNMVGGEVKLIVGPDITLTDIPASAQDAEQSVFEFSLAIFLGQDDLG